MIWRCRAEGTDCSRRKDVIDSRCCCRAASIASTFCSADESEPMMIAITNTPTMVLKIVNSVSALVCGTMSLPTPVVTMTAQKIAWVYCVLRGSRVTWTHGDQSCVHSTKPFEAVDIPPHRYHELFRGMALGFQSQNPSMSAMAKYPQARRCQRMTSRPMIRRKRRKLGLSTVYAVNVDSVRFRRKRRISLKMRRTRMAFAPRISLLAWLTSPVLLLSPSRPRKEVGIDARASMMNHWRR
mmetsp:Transcript_25974/g.83518  ORF Transcript_25974/g.83518 Transcript_25974/m.83518 type:complete len:240 (-) Transcript_25974:366-1085(-)